MRSFFRVQFKFARVVHGLSVCLGLGSLLAYFSWAWWPFEILNHFRLQAMALSILAMVFYFVRRKALHSFLLLTCALLNFAVVSPHLFFFGNHHQIVNYPDNFKIMHLNVDLENMEYDKVLSYIKQEQPDFLLLEEINDEWAAKLEMLYDDYPHAFNVPRQDSFGFAFFSKVPILQPSLIYFDSSDVPAMLVGINLGDQILNIFGLHTTPPIGSKQMSQRNEQLFTVSKILNKRKSMATLVLGDLNATPWSYALQEMVEGGKLNNAINSPGIFGTWPCNNRMFRIPVDHCLASDRIIVLDRIIGPDVGSEHLPVVVKFAIEKNLRRRARN